MHVVKCPMPKSLLSRSAILNAGFRCSLSHCNPKALKTDAPPQFLWDLSRAIVSVYASTSNLEHLHAILGKEERYFFGETTGRKRWTSNTKCRTKVGLLKTPNIANTLVKFRHEISFTLHPEATAKSQANHLLRFQDNKGKNWGPKPKAKGSVNSVQAGFQDSASATDG